MASTLGTDKAERKVWIIKVPRYVARQWREAIAASADAAIDENAQDAVLGKMQLQEGVATKLLVPGGDSGSETQTLYVNPTRDTADTAILSYEPTADGGMQAPQVDGVVFKRFAAAPAQLSDVPLMPVSLTPQQVQQQAQGQLKQGSQVDAAYLQQSRKRLAAAARPQQARRTAIIEDDKEIARLAGGTKDAPLYVKNRQAKQAAVVSNEPRKRMRMSKDDLEEKLLELFTQQSHWNFVQIQKTLDQPVAFLKEVLNEVAEQVKRGPNKDLWELKKHLRGAAAPQRPAAAAAGPGGT